jgi:hypothetical protein
VTGGTGSSSRDATGCVAAEPGVGSGVGVGSRCAAAGGDGGGGRGGAAAGIVGIAPGAGVGAVVTTPPARSTIASPQALHFSRYAFPGAGSAEDAYFFPHFGHVNRTPGV